RADSGRKITRQFCPECGSPLFTRAEVCPDLVFIKAGSLDEPELIEPSYQTWTEREVPWAHINPALPAYPKGGSAPKENDA
ncbi:MAG: GFA family protein, partial [Planctomycetota bacterium]